MEVQSSLFLRATSGAITVEVSEDRNTVTAAGTDPLGVTQTLSTSYAALNTGNMSFPCDVVIKNESSTPGQYAILDMASDGTKIFGRVYPGRAVKHTLTAAPQVKSAAGTPTISIVGAEI
jgi:hypothetical protein